MVTRPGLTCLSAEDELDIDFSLLPEKLVKAAKLAPDEPLLGMVAEGR